MWDFYGQDDSNELLLFHNHPYNPLNFLLDNLPLASRQDLRGIGLRQGKLALALIHGRKIRQEAKRVRVLRSQHPAGDL